MTRYPALAGAAIAAALLLFRPDPALAACANPAGVEGQAMYNATHHVPQYCDGVSWNGMRARIRALQ